MRAWVYGEYTGAAALRLEEVPTPVPGPAEVLVKLKAVAVNDWDHALLTGEITNRLMNGWFRPKKVRTVGSDVAGEVVAVGASVSRLTPGDAVYGDLCMSRFGAFAEYVCAPESVLFPKPATMSFEQAAAIPQAGMLAVQGLLDSGRLEAGQKLLLNGAGGGVGTFAIQIARQFEDVEITCVDKYAKLDLLTQLGADHVVDYEREDFTRRAVQYDLVLDAKTNRSASDYLRVLNPDGSYVTVGGRSTSLLKLFIASRVPGNSNDGRLRIVALKPNKDLAYMEQLFETGAMRPVIDGPWRFDDVPEAMAHFARGDHLGKIVITMAGTP